MAKLELKTEIAHILADGSFHSGEELGQLFGVSRTAISNHVKALIELGLDIFSVHGKGYKLAESLDLLNAEEIQKGLDNINSIDVFPIIDSTNEFLMTKIRNSDQIADGHTILAECQTSGRGRRGRTWVSPFGSHIYFSQYRMMEDGLAAASGLSLAVGVAVKNACQVITGLELQLKWPNDILYQKQKVAGILVEAEGQSDGVCHLVIGIGINVDMPQGSAEQIDQPWTDLKQLSERQINRNEIAIELCHQLNIVIKEYREHRLDNLYQEWNLANAFKDSMVNIIANKNTQTGRCLGIDQSGALIVENPTDGSRFKVFGGEVSLRGTV